MRIYRFDEIENTNNFLKEKEDLLEGDLVITKIQTHGRGRLGKPWISSNGSAIFSFAIIHDTLLQDSDYNKLPLLAGYALLKSLKKIEDLNFKFKWTNDIYINDKKISGILIEKIYDRYLVGIGINVNNKISDELKDKGTSLFEVTGKIYDIDKLILACVIEFFEVFNQFKNGKWTNILKEINAHNYLLDKQIDIITFDKIERGIAGNILDDGMLEVFVDGVSKKYNVGDIHIPKEKIKNNPSVL